MGLRRSLQQLKTANNNRLIDLHNRGAIATCICGVRPIMIKRQMGASTQFRIECRNCGNVTEDMWYHPGLHSDDPTEEDIEQKAKDIWNLRNSREK